MNHEQIRPPEVSKPPVDLPPDGDFFDGSDGPPRRSSIRNAVKTGLVVALFTGVLTYGFERYGNPSEELIRKFAPMYPKAFTSKLADMVHRCTNLLDRLSGRGGSSEVN